MFTIPTDLVEQSVTPTKYWLTVAHSFTDSLTHSLTLFWSHHQEEEEDEVTGGRWAGEEKTV